ncbi:MAG: hypothetical protein FWE47_01375 [Oscillospiraceae bacterium]|nr:hypothetical protein [Oscillospiraceae bacterium]
MDDKNYQVPLSALKAERAKGKRKLKLMEERMKHFADDRDQLTENLMDGSSVGGDAHIAPAEQTPIEIVTHDYLTELAQLIKNPNYADSTERIDELREYANEYGVSLKTAYNSLFAEEKFEKIRQKTEAEAMQKFQAKQARKIEAVDGGSGISKKVAKLNATQIAVAEMMGMTSEEYARYM